MVQEAHGPTALLPMPSLDQTVPNPAAHSRVVRVLFDYLLAFCCSASALILTFLISDPTDPVFLFLLVAIVVSTWYGGRASGLLALLTCLGGVVFFARTILESSAQEQRAFFVRLLAFGLTGLFMLALVSRFRSTKTLAADRLRGREEAEDRLRDTEEKLRHAQKMEALGRLAGGVEHDFNNLLNVIIGYSELLLENRKERHRTSQDYAKCIRMAGLSASMLTRQLLAFSRKQPLNEQVFDFNEVLREMAAILPRLLRENVELVIALAPDRLYVKADISQVQQVVLNLVVNARDAMPRGGKLSLKTFCRPSSREILSSQTKEAGRQGFGSYAVLEVSDTGVGMHPELQARIFEPFFTTKDTGQGTGLGLTTVKEVMERHEGLIRVNSRLGKGTTFQVYLPLIEAPALGTDSPERLAEQSSRARFKTISEDCTILLVEDALALRELTAEFLRSRNYTVLEAANAAEAIRICNEYDTAIDLMMTDLIMPGMNGLELADWLMGMRPDTKILIASGHVDEISSEVERLGGAVVLEKPYGLDVLEQSIEKLLQTAPVASLVKNRPRAHTASATI